MTGRPVDAIDADLTLYAIRLDHDRTRHSTTADADRAKIDRLLEERTTALTAATCDALDTP